MNKIGPWVPLASLFLAMALTPPADSAGLPGQLRRGIEASRLALSKLGRDHTWPLMTMAAMHFRLGLNAEAAAA